MSRVAKAAEPDHYISVAAPPLSLNFTPSQDFVELLTSETEMAPFGRMIFLTTNTTSMLPASLSKIVDEQVGEGMGQRGAA